MPFTYHQLNQLKKCVLCGRQFKGDAKADNCPGVPIRPRKKTEVVKFSAYQVNRRVKPNAEPIAYLSEKHAKVRDEDYYIYQRKQTQIIDKNLPSAYYTKTDIPDKTAIADTEMRKLNIEPKEGAKPIAVILGHHGWSYYYSLKDTQPGNGLQYITKTRLRDEYHLSKKWIEKLGKPDFFAENPHYKNANPMQLYLVGKVKQFLKDNAEEYAQWLSKRDKLVLNAQHLIEANKKRSQIKDKIKEQNKRCVSTPL